MLSPCFISSRLTNKNSRPRPQTIIFFCGNFLLVAACREQKLQIFFKNVKEFEQGRVCYRWYTASANDGKTHTNLKEDDV